MYLHNNLPLVTLHAFFSIGLMQPRGVNCKSLFEGDGPTKWKDPRSVDHGFKEKTVHCKEHVVNNEANFSSVKFLRLGGLSFPAGGTTEDATPCSSSFSSKMSL